ncbi:hypothetical protein GGH94_004505 [Coemansia aciculifera]|uniref:Protein kinase domain-containing protein n=1 Tax=Coemansia aciculifera TaxID=417176 RepID=A0A9W8IF56_9FUNG|nr:hypothetical protein GGH94_004505 [Coemansia aciculifera]
MGYSRVTFSDTGSSTLSSRTAGSSIEDYLVSKHKRNLWSDAFVESVKSIVQQTLRCLVQARVKGDILQRDVSPGNIMVSSGGTVRAIDWGYAKLLVDNSLDCDDDNKATSDRKALTSKIRQ